MCGIAGIFEFRGQIKDPDIIKRMTDTLIHRGPDDEGYYYNSGYSNLCCDNPASVYNNSRHANPGNVCRSEGRGNVALGHRRLSIIDLSGGHQPLCNENNAVWTVFNGEIYNFLSIKERLQGKGHIFRTNSDTETIVHAYEEWGEECVNYFRGMFAFAIWDVNTGSLFIARDRLGVKPLYYMIDENRILFASELKAILAYGLESKTIDPTALYDYLCLLYIPAPKTIFKDIKKLLPGHTLMIKSDGAAVIKKYWDINFGDVDTSETEEGWCRRIEEKLIESIKLRQISDVPVGAFLSGGVDSSAVTAIMSKLYNNPITTVSIGFEEQKFNETSYARAIAARYHTNHIEKIVKADSAKILDKLVWYFDEPFADSSAVPTYYVSEAARQSVTVILSGDGGDENFAGYRRHYFDLLENRLRAVLPAPFRRYFIGSIARLYPKANWLPRMFRAKTLLSNLALSPTDGYYNSMSYFGSLKSQILNPEYAKQLKDYNPSEIFSDYAKHAGSVDPLSVIQYIDIKTYLVDDILTKVDRASMANSLEAREPLLDHELMELIAKIPSGLKLKGREGKYIFKKMLKPYVPDDILYRTKMGFSIPLADWMRNELRDIFCDTVLSGRNDIGSYLNINTIKIMWNSHQKGASDYASELWAILFFAVWLERWGK